MNIGIFTDAYYPQISGVVTSTRILKNELENLGHKVTIVTVSDPNAPEEEENILRLPSIPYRKAPNVRIGAFYSTKLMKKIKNLNLDIIHTQTEFSIGFFARIVSKTLCIPIVHTYHTMYEDYTHYFAPKRADKLAKKFTRKASKVLCNTVDEVVVPTDKVKTKLREYGLDKTINTIPTGIDFKPFNKNMYSTEEINNLKKDLEMPINKKVILFVGRIAKEKNIDIVIESMKNLLKKRSDVVLLIVGDGPELVNLRNLVKINNVEPHVFFTGEVPWENIGKYYQLGDIFVSASTSETQGLTFLEAMASMLPVAAKYDTNLDGVIENNINGKFFYEAHELADTLQELLINEELRTNISFKAYEMIKPLSSSYFGSRIENVYYEAIKNKQQPRVRKLSGILNAIIN